MYDGNLNFIQFSFFPPPYMSYYTIYTPQHLPQPSFSSNNDDASLRLILSYYHIFPLLPNYFTIS